MYIYKTHMSYIWRFPESWGVPLVSSKSWMTMI